MRIINVITLHLWKSHESLYCLIVDSSSLDLARTERSIPRIKGTAQNRLSTNEISYDTAKLVVGITTSIGDYHEVAASVDVGRWESNGSISIYASELNGISGRSLLDGEIELLRYEI